MSCDTCCTDSCPSPVSVQVNVTNIQFDGANSSFRGGRFSRAMGTVTADSSGAYRVITLPYSVAQPESVVLVRNSGVQRRDVDFVISGDQIYLTREDDGTDEFTVQWFSSAPTVAVGSDDVGTLRGFAAAPASGWLAMDGGMSPPHSKATYAALWTYLAANESLLVGGAAGNSGSTFTLILITFPFYNGSSFQTLQGYIHV